MLDIFFDHFLAKNWEKFSAQTLRSFADEIYSICRRNSHLLVSDLDKFATYMITNDLLFNYQYVASIDKVFKAMSRRFKYENPLYLGSEILLENYDKLEIIFLDFFKDLETSVTETKKGPIL
jgi:acyl carrier protein phosphodiesterase